MFRLNQIVLDSGTEIAVSGCRTVYETTPWPTILSAHRYEDIKGVLITFLGNAELAGNNCALHGRIWIMEISAVWINGPKLTR